MLPTRPIRAIHQLYLEIRSGRRANTDTRDMTFATLIDKACHQLTGDRREAAIAVHNAYLRMNSGHGTYDTHQRKLDAAIDRFKYLVIDTLTDAEQVVLYLGSEELREGLSAAQDAFGAREVVKAVVEHALGVTGHEYDDVLVDLYLSVPLDDVADVNDLVWELVRSEQRTPGLVWPTWLIEQAGHRILARVPGPPASVLKTLATAGLTADQGRTAWTLAMSDNAPLADAVAAAKRL